MRKLLTLTVLVAACASCSRDGDSPDGSDKISVFVTIPPQAHFVERIGGGRVHVEVLVGPGQEPHTFDPSAKQMARLGGADVFFHLGATFERRLAEKIRTQFKDLRVVDTRKGVPLLKLPGAHDGHGREDDTDPHIWLDPKLAGIQARTICEALCEIDADHAGEYRRNLRAFIADLDRVDAEIAELLRPVRDRTFYVFHPAFAYFAASYGLTQRAVEFEGKEPSQKKIAELIALARRDGVRAIFVRPQFKPDAVRTIADQIGAAVVPLDPLARDYLKNLRDIADKIQRALTPHKP